MDTVAHVLKLGGVGGADLPAALRGGAGLGEELSELGEASGHPVGGAVLEVLHGGGEVGAEGADILDARLKAVAVLSLESAKEALGEIRDVNKVGKHCRFAAI